MMGIYVFVGIIALGLIMKFWPLFSLIFKMIWYAIKFVFSLFTKKKEDNFSSI